MNRFRYFSLLFALVLLMLGSTAQAETLSWKGCGITKKAFMKEMAQAYTKMSGVEVKLSGGGATKGIRAVSAGTADVGGSCRQPLRNGKGGIHPDESKPNFIPVAWDALVVVVHPDNSVDSITLDNLKKIYDGKITNWKDLGGPDKRIALVTRDGKSSGVGHMFRMLVFNDADYTFKARSLKVKSTGPLEKKIEKTSTALGMDGISSAKKKKLKFLAIDGVKPSKENIGNGTYKLFRPLYLVINKKPSDSVKKLIDFVLSDEGQNIVSQQGTVNLKEGSALTAKWQAIRSGFTQ